MIAADLVRLASQGATATLLIAGWPRSGRWRCSPA
jgi:hypothetical protein